MVSKRRQANAVGGKTARACDGCVCNRARWFCAADDAFLCQSCDISIHSVNPLACRHERVLLKMSPFKPPHESTGEPSWHRGFTTRARTPRNGKNFISKRKNSKETTQYSDTLVPDLGSGETSYEENEEQSSSYRVPISGQFVDNSSETGYGGSDLNEFLLPSEMELSEFAADVESLLGKGLEEESFDMEALGIFDWEKKDSRRSIKVEEEEMNSMVGDYVDAEIDMEKELTYEFNFDFDEEENEEGGGGRVKKEESEEGKNMGEVRRKKKEKVLLLRLDYEGIITAWDNQRSPWTTGDRPELRPSECWPDCLGSCGTIHHPYGDIGVIGGSTAMGDGGREARVSRYREKRRTRLFSKKIRYEVRKLNAEKRPRMKGRFVKRADFANY